MAWPSSGAAAGGSALLAGGPASVAEGSHVDEVDVAIRRSDCDGSEDGLGGEMLASGSSSSGTSTIED